MNYRIGKYEGNEPVLDIAFPSFEEAREEMTRLAEGNVEYYNVSTDPSIVIWRASFQEGNNTFFLSATPTPEVFTKRTVLMDTKKGIKYDWGKYK